MNTPKKIWMGDNAFAWAMEDDIFNIPYIRADLVDGLVEALEGVLPFTVIGDSEEANEATSKAIRVLSELEAALAKQEEK